MPLACLYWKYTRVGNDPLKECVSKYLQGTQTISLWNKKGWKDLLLGSEVTILAMEGLLTFASEVFSWEIPAGIHEGVNSNPKWWVIGGLLSRWENVRREYNGERALKKKTPPAAKACGSPREWGNAVWNRWSDNSPIPAGSPAAYSSISKHLSDGGVDSDTQLSDEEIKHNISQQKGRKSWTKPLFVFLSY